MPCCFELQTIFLGFLLRSFTFGYIEFPLVRNIFLFPLRIRNSGVQLYIKDRFALINNRMSKYKYWTQKTRVLLCTPAVHLAGKKALLTKRNSVKLIEVFASDEFFKKHTTVC